ncbi:hypothetical protein D0N36_06915 [Hymenobacter lapidiphilus]|uniref:hypothetical protein n=1 Tax=Hymenobacter sp. CCM 8763 TaxID=2303334 RepID=UPI000E356E56|nr:hypothetical protein [Hymenobacter sp. CCM 8763]RFP65929.1 hypothetical protein D0N36_06915 [Hymenobacter sp. CCM 8763]
MSSPALILADGGRLPLADGQRVALTIQDNNILQPASVQAAYSNTLTLADAPPVRAALAQAQHGPALTVAPYQRLACAVEAGGLEVLPGATAYVEAHTAGEGFECQVVGGNQDLYSALEGKKLRELQFPASTAHEWTRTNAAIGSGRLDWRQGYVYELHDRGKGGPEEGARVHIYEELVLASVYARAAWEQIFTEAGRQWSGPMPELFDRLTLPTVAGAAYSEAFRNARRLVAGIGGNRGEYGRAYEGRPELMRTVPYDTTPTETGFLAPSESLVWNPVTHSWRAKEACYVSVDASLNVELSSPFGSAKAQLFALVNGKQVSKQVEGQPVPVAGPAAESKKGADSTYVTATLNESRLLLARGDELSIRVRLNPAQKGFGGSQKWGYEMFAFRVITVAGNTLPLDKFSVTVLADFPPGGLVRLADLLPDWSQKDFVKAIIGLFGLTQQTNAYTQAVRLAPTGPALAQNLSGAADWSGKVDGSAPATRSFHLPDTARRNFFRWKEDDTNPESAQQLGDGCLDCPDATLDAERDALVLPWAATTTGTNGLPLLPTFARQLGTPSLTPTYEKRTPQPRLLARTGRTRRVLLTDDTGSSTVIFPISDFAGLDFAVDLLPAYYTHLRAAYARPLVLRPLVRLNGAEVAAFDQLRPVWLEREGSYFYCNKIDGWEADAASTRVELLRLTY